MYESVKLGIRFKYLDRCRMNKLEFFNSFQQRSRQIHGVETVYVIIVRSAVEIVFTPFICVRIFNLRIHLNILHFKGNI